MVTIVFRPQCVTSEKSMSNYVINSVSADALAPAGARASAAAV